MLNNVVIGLQDHISAAAHDKYHLLPNERLKYIDRPEIHRHIRYAEVPRQQLHVRQGIALTEGEYAGDG